MQRQGNGAVDRPNDKPTDRPTDRPAERATDRLTDRPTLSRGRRVPQEIYQGFTLQNNITDSYHGIMLQNWITEL